MHQKTLLLANSEWDGKLTWAPLHAPGNATISKEWTGREANASASAGEDRGSAGTGGGCSIDGVSETS